MSQLSLVPRQEQPKYSLSTSVSRVKVKAGDRWLLMGTSGSGKTTAAKMLDANLAKLYPTSRHYILDSKIDGDFDEYPGKVMTNMCPPRPGKNERYQVWQVVKIVPEEIEKWLWGVRKDGPAFLFIDELSAITYSRKEFSDEYNIIQKTGRSLNVGSITLTQELSKIPANAYKQAVHRLGFYLEGRYDVLIRNDMLKQKVLQPDDNYGFFYQHINSRGAPLYFPSVQHFLH